MMYRPLQREIWMNILHMWSTINAGVIGHILWTRNFLFGSLVQ